MRIGIDARMLRYSGIGEYIRNLVENLARIDRENQYLLFAKENDLEICKINQENFSFQVVKAPLFSLSEQIVLPFEIKKNRLDIFHTPHFNISLFSPVKKVVTIHDLIPLIFPGARSSRLSRAYYRFMNSQATKKARKIIVDSKNTKRDLLKFFKVPEGKTEVIYGGVSERFRPVNDAKSLEEVEKKFNTTKKFLLYAGLRKPHKNLVSLIKVLEILRRKMNFDIQLVMVGKKDPRFTQVEEAAKELELEDDVLFLGEVSDEDLVLLYNAAQVFLFPSLYEGFGLSPLEAMACGTPVISSNTSSLPEVLGDVAILLDPNDTIKWAEKIREVFTNEDLRKKLKHKGLERVKKFSWERTAQDTLRVYESLAS